ncbi:MAG: hypothetical protein ACLQVD_17875 [Capsulimonadaceae bacterium]
MNPDDYDAAAATAPVPRVRMGWIGEAFVLFLQDAGTWIFAVVVFAVISAVISLAFEILKPNQDLQTVTQLTSMLARRTGNLPQMWALIKVLARDMAPFYLLQIFWSAFELACFTRMAVMKVRGQPISLAIIFAGVENYLNVLLLYVLVLLVAFLPLLAFAYVGLTAAFLGQSAIVMAMWGFAALFLLAIGAVFLPACPLAVQKIPAWQALALSVDYMASHQIQAFGLLLAYGMLVLVSALPLGLGVLVTYPMLFLIMAFACREIVERPAPKPVPVAPKFDEWPEHGRDKRLPTISYKPMFYGANIVPQTAAPPEPPADGPPAEQEEGHKPRIDLDWKRPHQ